LAGEPRPLAGVYDAKVVSVTATTLTLLVPTVYLSSSVPCDKWVGTAPAPGDMGVVAFLQGDAAWPVWLGKVG